MLQYSKLVSFVCFAHLQYDFHGECDLVLLHNPDFMNGLGMDIHIRTKIESFWSSVESAVIKIGDHTMEIRADPKKDAWIWFDGQVPEDVQTGSWQRHNVGDFLVRYKDTPGSKGNTREANLYLVHKGNTLRPLQAVSKKADVIVAPSRRVDVLQC